MVTIGMNYRILPGKERVFEEAFESVLRVMQGMDGHDASSLYRGVGDPGEYLIVSRWSDQAAFDAFIASDRFKKVTDWGSENILAGRPSHTTYGEG
jgi:heme-degrading monooxygenase HmoA